MKLHLEITVNNHDQDLFRALMTVAGKLELENMEIMSLQDDLPHEDSPEWKSVSEPQPEPVKETEFYYLYAGGSPEQAVTGKYATEVTRNQSEVADILPEGYILITHDRNMNVVKMEKRQKDGSYQEWDGWRSSAPVNAPSQPETTITMPFLQTNLPPVIERSAPPQPASTDSPRLKADGTPRGKPGRKPKNSVAETAPTPASAPVPAGPVLHTTPPLPVQMQQFPQQVPQQPVYQQPNYTPPPGFTQETPFSAPPVMLPVPNTVQAPSAPPVPLPVPPPPPVMPPPPPVAAVPQVNPQPTILPNGIISLEDLKSLSAKAFNKHNIAAFGLLSGRKWLDGTDKPFYDVFTIENVPQEHWNRLAQDFATLGA